jgi:DMSO reductase family type II enzyme heme b subunit
MDRGCWVPTRVALTLGIMAGCGYPQPRVPDSTDDQALGQAVFDAQCRDCHGPSGDGRGPASRYLVPRPRDFLREPFRIRSTAREAAPSDGDLRAVLTRGVPGSAMPSFAFLAPEELNAVIGHVKSLSPVFSAANPPVPLDIGAAPPSTPEVLAAGKALYQRLDCGSCHGETGRGDGEHADDLLDARDAPIRCRDLVNDAYKGGASVRDIYLRISSGMDGTPMPRIGDDKATASERWQLAAYVASLHAGGAPDRARTANGRMIVSSRAHRRVPTGDPLADEWSVAVATTLPLFPLVSDASRRPGPGRLIVRSLHDQQTIAFRLEWTDATQNDQVNETEKFADGAALQFVTGDRAAFLGMGERNTPVRIWHWKADWQREVDAQAARRLAAPAVDGPVTPLAVLPANAARNPYAANDRRGPVEEGIAGGAGTFTSRAVQRAGGAGVWKRDTWYVVLSRDFDRNELSISSNAKLAFAVWDGANGDRGAQKAISSWYPVSIAGQ